MPVWTVLMMLSSVPRQSVADREAVSADLVWSAERYRAMEPAEGPSVIAENNAERLRLEQFGHSRSSDDMSIAVPPRQEGAR